MKGVVLKIDKEKNLCKILREDGGEMLFPVEEIKEGVSEGQIVEIEVRKVE